MAKCLTLSEFQRTFCKTGLTATDYHFHIYNSIDEVPALIIEQLGTEQHFFFSKGYWKIFEQTFSGKIKCRYVVISNNGNPVGFAPLQLIIFKGSNVSNEVQEKVWWKQARKYITGKIVNLFSMQLLVIGNTFLTGEFAFYLKQGYKLTEKTASAFYNSIIQIQNDEKNLAGILIKDFYPETAEKFSILNENGYLKFEVNPNMEVAIKQSWHTMADYESDLSSRYRIRYHKALARANTLDFLPLNEELIVKYEPQLTEMLNEILDRSDFKLENPDVQYLKLLQKQFPESFHIHGIFKNHELIGFYSAYLSGKNQLVACFVGMNKSLLKEHDLYLNILYKLVELAIQLKASDLHFGRTAMEIKSSVGAVPKKMFLFVRHVNPLINKLVHFAVKTLSKNPEWTVRNPFKKTSGT